MDIHTSFSGVQRVYGTRAYSKINQAKICVIGIGGVGSWCAEALARTAIGSLTLIDLDDIAESNINRQIHALQSTKHLSKVVVMEKRILDINPLCQVRIVEDFVTADTLSYLDDHYDVVIDAIDSVKAKAAIINYCKRRKIKVITLGGAGGQLDPLKITSSDLAKTRQDPLAAKLRSELRRNFGFSKNPKRNFGVECIYSLEQLRYPSKNGETSFEKSNQQGTAKMDCQTGFGSSVAVTCTFGMIAASRALEHITK